MKPSTIIFLGALLVASSSFVGGRSDISTLTDLFTNMQNLFGLLGVVGSVITAYFTDRKPGPKPASKKDLSVN